MGGIGRLARLLCGRGPANIVELVDGTVGPSCTPIGLENFFLFQKQRRYHSATEITEGTRFTRIKCQTYILSIHVSELEFHFRVENLARYCSSIQCAGLDRLTSSTTQGECCSEPCTQQKSISARFGCAGSADVNLHLIR